MRGTAAFGPSRCKRCTPCPARLAHPYPQWGRRGALAATAGGCGLRIHGGGLAGLALEAGGSFLSSSPQSIPSLANVVAGLKSRLKNPGFPRPGAIRRSVRRFERDVVLGGFALLAARRGGAAAPRRPRAASGASSRSGRSTRPRCSKSVQWPSVLLADARPLLDTPSPFLRSIRPPRPTEREEGSQHFHRSARGVPSS